MNNRFFLFFICIVLLLISCTRVQKELKYTHQIPDSLIIDADTATVIPAFQKEIGDTKVVCYIVDTISGKYNGGKVSVELCEVGNPINTKKTTFVERDSFVVDFPDMVGTSGCICTIELDTLYVYFHIYIEPCKTNKVWIMPQYFSYYGHNIYSNNIYNSINHANAILIDRFYPYDEFATLNKYDFIDFIIHHKDSVVNSLKNASERIHPLVIEKKKHELYLLIDAYNVFRKHNSGKEVPMEERIHSIELSDVFNKFDFNSTLLLYSYYCEKFLANSSLNLENHSKDIISLSNLARLCAKYDKNLWEETNENAADYIGDDFCIAAYKHYREQGIEAYTRSNNGVYIEEVPKVSNDSLLFAIKNKYGDRRIIIDFWGTNCGPCVREIQLNEDKKDVEIAYIYITCPSWSPYPAWNRFINNTMGYHYYVSDEAFSYMLAQYGNYNGGIPFKLYFSADGKLERSQIGAEY